jgi:hypothetical protein
MLRSVALSILGTAALLGECDAFARNAASRCMCLAVEQPWKKPDL